MKTLVDLRNEMREVFNPMSEVEVMTLNDKEFGNTLTIETDTYNYLENERLIVATGDNFYNLNRFVFNMFRINALEGRYFTYTNYKMHKTLDDAYEYIFANKDKVITLSRNVFKDENGNYTDICYYTQCLEA